MRTPVVSSACGGLRCIALLPREGVTEHIPLTPPYPIEARQPSGARCTGRVQGTSFSLPAKPNVPSPRLSPITSGGNLTWERRGEAPFKWHRGAIHFLPPQRGYFSLFFGALKRQLSTGFTLVFFKF